MHIQSVVYNDFVRSFFFIVESKKESVIVRFSNDKFGIFRDTNIICFVLIL